MKKFAALFMALMMLFTMGVMAETLVDSPDAGDIVDSPSAGDIVDSPDAEAVEVAFTGKIGQVLWAAHGTKCFAVITAVVQDDVIVAAYIDEFQFMDATTAVGVPNSDQAFGESFPEGKVLASKRVNSDMYSASMANAGSTVALADNYAAIEAFVVGMTVAELEATIADMTAETAVDAVSGATLVDTLGYLQGILAAAKAAQ